MAKKETKYVYFFGDGKAEGKAEMKNLLGGKGANLAEMSNLGLPVPPGFTISTEACDEFEDSGGKWPAGLDKQINRNLKRIEELSGRAFGSGPKPLLLSVRSGAEVSMPGMMDTVLNLGLTGDTIEAMIALTGNQRFVWDTYRRLIQMFGDVVLAMDSEEFEDVLQKVKQQRDAELDTDLDVEALKEVVDRYHGLYERQGKAFPQDPRQQLTDAVGAVFASWSNPRAVEYRELNDIRDLRGTAVNVQMMVFGNIDRDSGTGVAFTRNPATGDNSFWGEYLMNAQGEDVVAGVRTPRPVQELNSQNRKVYMQLLDIRETLENHYHEMQDIEFTIEQGKLYILQTRTGKRTAAAAVKIAVDMMKDGLIDEKQAVQRIEPGQIGQLLHPGFDDEAEANAYKLAEGLPASPGAASGQVVFAAADAEAWASDGKDVILCRIETSPEDIGGMHAACGVLTSRGGITSHAAVVARAMGKCCVAGCDDAIIDYKEKTLSAGRTVLSEGDWISLNGTTGQVYKGRIDTVEAKLTGMFTTVMKLADKYRRLGVRANADTPGEVAKAVEFGAEGIGLCRTEHMFFQGTRITSMRKMILADDEEVRKEALEEMLPLQRDDFIAVFKALKGRPATIRLLDPPLHEFVPHDEADQRETAEAMGLTLEKIREKAASLEELNPMLGHRGCRLGITHPEITAMQARTVIEAAYAVRGAKAEIMIPLVGDVRELINQKRIVLRVFDEIKKERKRRKIPDIKIGTMIEVPRSAVAADELACEAEFFSFGTNDLTQMTFGFSRDDAGKFLKPYVEEYGIYSCDPFRRLDRKGVGALIEMAVRKGRSVQPDLKLGICGEHGGDPPSIEFCHLVGLDYVSCSPYRVPIARLAAAQAALNHQAEKAKQ